MLTRYSLSFISFGTPRIMFLLSKAKIRISPSPTSARVSWPPIGGWFALAVDLGLLQLSAEVDVHRLPFGENVESGVCRLAVPVTRLFGPAEWKLDLGPDGRG